MMKKEKDWQTLQWLNGNGEGGGDMNKSAGPALETAQEKMRMDKAEREKGAGMSQMPRAISQRVFWRVLHFCCFRTDRAQHAICSNLQARSVESAPAPRP